MLKYFLFLLLCIYSVKGMYIPGATISNCKHLCGKNKHCSKFDVQGHECTLFNGRRVLEDDTLIVEKDHWTPEELKKLVFEVLIYVVLIVFFIVIGYMSGYLIIQFKGLDYIENESNHNNQQQYNVDYEF